MFAAVGLQMPIALHVPPAGQSLPPPPAVQTVVQTWMPSAWNVWHIGAAVMQSCSVAHESYGTPVHLGPRGSASTFGGVSPLHAASTSTNAKQRMH